MFQRHRETLQVVPLCVEALGTANVIGEVERWERYITQRCSSFQTCFSETHFLFFGGGLGVGWLWAAKLLPLNLPFLEFSWFYF